MEGAEGDKKHEMASMERMTKLAGTAQTRKQDLVKHIFDEDI